MLLYGFNLEGYFQAFLDKTTMIHLHGIINGVDHRGLEGISKRNWEVISQALSDYQGGLSLEVFSQEDLMSSLQRLEEILR